MWVTGQTGALTRWVPALVPWEMVQTQGELRFRVSEHQTVSCCQSWSCLSDWTGIFHQPVSYSRPNDFDFFLMFLVAPLVYMLACKKLMWGCDDSLWAAERLALVHRSPASFLPPQLAQKLGHWARGNWTMTMPNIRQEPHFAHLPQPCISAPSNSSPPHSQRALVLFFISSLWKQIFQPRYTEGSSRNGFWGMSYSSSLTQTQLLLSCLSLTLLTFGTMLFSVVGMCCAL